MKDAEIIAKLEQQAYGGCCDNETAEIMTLAAERLKNQRAKPKVKPHDVKGEFSTEPIIRDGKPCVAIDVTIMGVNVRGIVSDEVARVIGSKLVAAANEAKEVWIEVS